MRLCALEIILDYFQPLDAAAVLLYIVERGGGDTEERLDLLFVRGAGTSQGKSVVSRTRFLLKSS